MKKSILLGIKCKSQYLVWFSIGLLYSAHVFADYDIGGPSGGPFSKIVKFIQDIVNLIDGPVALAFSFFSIAGVAIVWAIAPKMMGAMGLGVRIIIAIIIILNIGTWITALNS